MMPRSETRTSKRALAAVCAAALVVALAVPALAPRGRAAEPAAAFNPMAGDGMWIWYVSRAGGSAARIAQKARRNGIEVVFIKSADAHNSWSQFSPQLVRDLQARGLKVCAWQFVYGRGAKAEADAAIRSVRRGADCFVIDAEGHYEGRYAQASTYTRRLRSAVGSEYPLALASFPYVDYHPAFPFSVFLGPGGAQYNLPQLYWKTIGARVDAAFIHTWVFNRPYDRAIMPLGQVYLNPKPKQIRRFRRLVLAHDMEGVSWWSWQHAGRQQWKAVRAPVAEPSGYEPYDSYPTLRLGSQGDLVAWAQQLLRGGGYSTPVSGYFEASTRSALLAMQNDAGLEETGEADPATWERLLEFEPLPVRWTKNGAVPASGAGVVLPEPRSADLPAQGYEIPPGRR
ncbi:MAG TPA: peptidoglycan-binding domain-containing protein [Solirubrobacterales bacterium]|jgi:hypothetical protein|nr:peptidoglycan-binding domain-containing protein [Solirubrobacterales bacterium]